MTQKFANEPVVIVGAGIGGLTSALAFSQAGMRVEIFERAERLTEVGAGLQLSPNALRVLYILGLKDALQKLSTASSHVTLRSGPSGRRIAAVPVEGMDGLSYIALHRADLQAVLQKAVEADPAITLHLGHELSGLKIDGERARVAFTTSAGDVVRFASIVVGADGVHSRAAVCLGLDAPVSTGRTAWRLSVPCPPQPGNPAIQAWLGAGRHAVAYPVRNGKEINLVLIVPSALQTIEDVRAAYRQWDPALRGLIDNGRPLGSWPILAVDVERRLVERQNFVFVGDAAHAMPPYAAQGAAQAIEDAWVLAKAVQTNRSIPDAISSYVIERRRRIARVAKRVAFHQFIYHLPTPLSWGRDAALRLKSPAALRREMGWLYDWRPSD